MAQIINLPDLGTQLGEGLSGGLQQLAQYKLQQHLQGLERAQQAQAYQAVGLPEGYANLPAPIAAALVKEQARQRYEADRIAGLRGAAPAAYQGEEGAELPGMATDVGGERGPVDQKRFITNPEDYYRAQKLEAQQAALEEKRIARKRKEAFQLHPELKEMATAAIAAKKLLPLAQQYKNLLHRYSDRFPGALSAQIFPEKWRDDPILREAAAIGNEIFGLKLGTLGGAARIKEAVARLAEAKPHLGQPPATILKLLDNIEREALMTSQDYHDLLDELTGVPAAKKGDRPLETANEAAIPTQFMGDLIGDGQQTYKWDPAANQYRLAMKRSA